MSFIITAPVPIVNAPRAFFAIFPENRWDKLQIKTSARINSRKHAGKRERKGFSEK
jgi:hypothetical protein